MGQITLQIPQVGQLNGTEDPKIASDLTAIQTLVNGNLDDSNLRTPNNVVRRLLLQSVGVATSSFPGGTNVDFLLTTTPSTSGGTNGTVPLWAADSGLSSQPQDFQVANLTAKARVRMTMAVHPTTAPAVTYTAGLYQITGTAGSTNTIGLTFGAPVVGTTAAIASPSAGALLGVESAEFALPVSAGVYALGFRVSAAPTSGTAVTITLQLLGYNS